jgi:hypothetical protein
MLGALLPRRVLRFLTRHSAGGEAKRQSLVLVGAAQRHSGRGNRNGWCAERNARLCWWRSQNILRRAGEYLWRRRCPPASGQSGRAPVRIAARRDFSFAYCSTVRFSHIPPRPIERPWTHGSIDPPSACAAQTRLLPFVNAPCETRRLQIIRSNLPV